MNSLVLTIIGAIIGAIIAGIFTILAAIIAAYIKNGKQIPKKKLIIIIVIFSSVGLFIGGMIAANWEEPILEITYPLEGDGVNINVIVQGISGNIPEGQDIWVFVSIENRYYPVSYPAVVQEKGDWSSSATFGDEKDTGEYFTVYATLVNQKAQDAINTYITESQTSGISPGMDELPTGTAIYDKPTVIRNPSTRVTITFPLNNANVGRNCTVQGTSNDVPDGQVIWVYVYQPYRPNGEQYNPMQKTPITHQNGDWSAFATFGAPDEDGKEFQIIAILANQAAQDEINVYNANGEQTGIYPATASLPIGAVEYDRVIVTRGPW